MKILVADRISPLGVEYLQKQDGFEVVEAYGSSPEKVLELVGDVSAIIVRSDTKVTKEVIAGAPLLKAVGRAGVGVDNIDIEAATEKGVIVMNTPGGNTIATAELTFTHMMCGTRAIVRGATGMREGKWERKELKGSELRAKTLAVLGFGRIGAEVAKRAQAFEMKVIAYDPYLTEDRAKEMEVEKVELEDAFSRADYLTVHMPLTDETRNMVDEDAFSKMKDGVRVFNCARGGIIKETALAEALKRGKVAAAGLDVYEQEPLPEDHEFRSIENLNLTPHLGASTAEAQESVGVEIAEAVAEVLQGGRIRNAINMPSIDPKDIEVLKPYLDLCHRMGGFARQAAKGTVSSIHINYWGGIVDFDAVPLTRAVLKGWLSGIAGDEGINDVNAPHKIKALGIKVETIKSSSSADYSELIEVKTVSSDGDEQSVRGTLLGKGNDPRIVEVDGRAIEVRPVDVLLVVRNVDKPGIVGKLGTILGDCEVNIANMSLSRAEDREWALTICELDHEPPESALQALVEDSDIREARISRQG
ncbi:MAG TPA: phosphoglycerate dehydrogenase [Opitutae bacterium]|nr:phosphoglycerate dehydrogenase [Opitutae bacterium]|tara:strand:+ start:5698 stop:7293 length:1596 start_codon:yes stop_codon:yes gene_type:complete